jgi:hypothetical protein
MFGHQCHVHLLSAIGAVMPTEAILAIAVVAASGVVAVGQAVFVGSRLPYISALRLWRAWRSIARIFIGAFLAGYAAKLLVGVASRRETFATCIFGLVTLMIGLSLVLIVGTVSTAIILHVSVAKVIRSGELEILNRDIELRSILRHGRLLHRALACVDSPTVRSWMLAAMGRRPDNE